MTSIVPELAHPASPAISSTGCRGGRLNSGPIVDGPAFGVGIKVRPFEHSAANDIPGAKVGANVARHQAMSGHNEPAPSQVNGMLDYAQPRLATAQA